MKDPNQEKEVQKTDDQEVIKDQKVEEPTEKAEDATASESDKVSELEEKCETLHNDYLRLYAEFDNYRKRTLKEKSELIKSAGENILVNLLPLVDDFERAQKAMESSGDIDSVKEGVKLIYDKFLAFLSQNGIKAIDAEGKEFDLDFHEAITTIPAPTEDMKGKVIDCTQKGYTLNDKVIRFSKVVVGE